ncbi:hypothetical protein DM813_27690 [Pseudomonas alkylphenolica]|uniref:Uncharacterized protein n=1 Tax=Pseudomonas alkylphenolica TaxID=237609 RepID=A0A443ZEM5_9PSED|nr:hypothetical protein [Pseudomonas alkylphenolica]RWU17148.1 hypothetical protein DM813_27690 [Pseudomonas alkylphenolica]
MGDTSLVFKLYGDFHWPPTAELQADPARVRGCVEVHYVAWPTGTANTYRAYIVWKPFGIQNKDPAPPADGSITLYEQQDPAGWFAEKINTCQSIWIDGSAGNIKQPIRVAFRGAYLFEQYSLEGKRKLRWPLIPEYSNKTTSVYSALVITEGKRKTAAPLQPRFDFDLSLPLPVSHADNNQWAAFPLRAAFYPQVMTRAAIGEINEFFGRGFNKQKEQNFAFKTLPGSKHLGNFNLAAYGKGTETCASYIEQLENNSTQLENYWPRAFSPVAEKFLSEAGLSPAIIGETDYPVPGKGTLSDTHIRFLSTDGDVSTFTYRLTTNAKKIALKTLRDIEPDLELSPATRSSIHLDAYIKWSIPDQLIWTPEAWQPRIGFRLYWSEAFKVNDFPSTSLTTFARRLLADTFAQINATRPTLPYVEALQPVSLLPDLKVSITADRRFTFALIAEELQGSCSAYFERTARQQGAFLRWQSHAPAHLKMTMAKRSAQADDYLDDVVENNNSLPLRADLPAFFNSAKKGEALNLSLSEDESWAQREANAGDAGSPYFASFALNVTAIAENTGRIGALAFTFPKLTDLKTDADFLRTAGKGLGGPQAFRYQAGKGHLNATLRLTLPVLSVTPLSTDVARTDRSRRPAPLLIDMDQLYGSQNDSPAPFNYYLRATETFGSDDDRLLTVSLLDNALEQGERDYFLLAEEPYSVLRFRQTRLGARGNASSTEVALYSSDDRLWQLRMVSPLYHFMLPPQSIGESADKPNRLEIHDLSVLGATPSHPYIGDGDPYGKALKYRAVEFRLTPSTDLWVQPSDVVRGYFMPEQASYDLFRQRGEYGLGTALAGLRSEFLYGLSVSIEVSKERSVARFSRVSEISALTGDIVGPAREHEADPAITERWSRLSHAIARRPERLEVWTRDPDSPVDFAPARFAEGTRFSLRSTALHRPPLAQADSADASLPAAVLGQLRFHRQGLSGGALWPIESINLLNALKALPESHGGTLEQVALAPFGGDASQTAEFLKGIVKIISETRNGYIERQKVEVLGRVGSLWHRAKHVVVYERTVNPSAQFAPAFGVDVEGSRSRRPILRKVREYIELLEPVRLYPDFPQAAARTTGFLDRVRFNSRIINVDSAWGSEVGTFGWQVPLWNRAAARQRPQVYSMPDIAFVTVSEGEGETPLVAQECLDTDLLFFFADFKAATSDTNLWQARLDVDFANLPLAQIIAKTVDQASTARPVHSDTVNQRRPAVSRALPGARRFTWRLAPAARKTAINAGRADKPIYVGLESVSFMRASFTGMETGSEKFAHLGALLATSGKVDTLSDHGLWQPGQASTLAGVDTNEYVELVGTLMSARDQRSLIEAYDKLKDFFATNSTFGQRLGSALWDNAQLLHKAVDDDQDGNGSLLTAIKALDQKLADGESGCERLKNNAISQLRRKTLLIYTVLQDWQAGVDSLLKDLQGHSKDQVVQALATDIRRSLAPLFKEASDDVGNVAEGVEKARAILLSIEADADTLVRRAFARIDQLAVAYDRDKPWSAERKRAFRAEIRTAISSVAVDLTGAINEGRQRLSVELSDFAQQIGSQLGRALSLLAIEQNTALQGLGALNVAIRRKLVDFIATVNELSSDKVALFTNAIKLAHTRVVASDLAKPPNDTPANLKLKADVLQVLLQLDRLATGVSSRVTELVELLDKLSRQNDEVVESLALTVGALASTARTIIQDLKYANTAARQYSQGLIDAGYSDLNDLMLACWPHVEAAVEKLEIALAEPFEELSSKLDDLDHFVAELRQWIQDVLFNTLSALRDLNGTIDDALSSVSSVLDGLKQQLAPDQLLQRVVIEKVVVPALVEMLEPLPETLGIKDEDRAEATRRLALLADSIAKRLDALDTQALGALDQIADLCKKVFGSIDQAAQSLDQLTRQTAGEYTQKFDEARARFAQAYSNNLEDLDKVIAAARDFDRSVRNLQNDISRTVETAQMYGNRVLAAASRLGEGDLMAAPSNILKLYSAVSSAPELLGLKSDIERIRAGFDELSDIIDTTEAGALLNRMGDQLKALGISSNFDKLSDRILLKVDGAVGKLFNNISGVDLSKLFKGQMLRNNMSDAIRLTHDFDRQQARAWVQVDINAPMPGRNTLFSIGPFQCDFVDMQIDGQMRIEASKDSEEVKQTGAGRIAGTLDVMVSGQSMVSFEKFALNFTREHGLKIDFDPKNIRLNPAFQVVQDTLASLFPDMIGPLTVIKENGIPIGLEHEYVLPVISANAVTSGMSNLSIENRLRLIAYPDFVISDRFSLSRPERPFIFSLFILGGTGFVQIETEYRPFDSELTVTVDAAMGASALLGISAGPFSGQIFITLSAVLSYRKALGRPGGGLAVSALLVIAGNVDVAGIATAGIYATLRITYRDNGQVDADGLISVTIKISSFFTLSARAGVQYRLRNGHAETRSTSSVEAESQDLKEITNKASAAAKKIQGSMV